MTCGMMPVNPTTAGNLLPPRIQVEVDDEASPPKRKKVVSTESRDRRRLIEKNAAKTNKVWLEVKKAKKMSDLDDLEGLRKHFKDLDVNKKLADALEGELKANIQVHATEDKLLKLEWEQLAEKVEWWSDFKKETKLVAIHNDDVRNRDLARTLKERHEDRKVMNAWKEVRKQDECEEIELTSEAARIDKLEEELRRWKQLVYAHRRKEKCEVGVVKMCISCREELE